MNEVSTLCDGECPKGYVAPKTAVSVESVEADTTTDWYHAAKDQDTLSTYSLPFTPFKSMNLDAKTLSLNATHSNMMTEYDLHNLHNVL
jgi:hypothetical protein